MQASSVSIHRHYRRKILHLQQPHRLRNTELFKLPDINNPFYSVSKIRCCASYGMEIYAAVFFIASRVRLHMPPFPIMPLIPYEDIILCSYVSTLMLVVGPDAITRKSPLPSFSKGGEERLL